MINLKLYHGSNYPSIKKILDNNKFESIKVPSIDSIIMNNNVRKMPGTLGYGLYAFDCYELAKGFVKYAVSESYTAIISFDVSVRKDNVLDLTKSNDLKMIRNIMEELKPETLNRIKNNFKDNNYQKSREGAFIDKIIQLLGSYKESQSIFLVKSATNNKVNSISGFNSIPNGIEYCIKNTNIILKNSIKLISNNDKGENHYERSKL